MAKTKSKTPDHGLIIDLNAGMIQIRTKSASNGWTNEQCSEVLAHALRIISEKLTKPQINKLKSIAFNETDNPDPVLTDGVDQSAG